MNSRKENLKNRRPETVDEFYTRLDREWRMSQTSQERLLHDYDVLLEQSTSDKLRVRRYQEENLKLRRKLADAEERAGIMSVLACTFGVTAAGLGAIVVFLLVTG